MHPRWHMLAHTTHTCMPANMQHDYSTLPAEPLRACGCTTLHHCFTPWHHIHPTCPHESSKPPRCHVQATTPCTNRGMCGTLQLPPPAHMPCHTQDLTTALVHPSCRWAHQTTMWRPKIKGSLHAPPRCTQGMPHAPTPHKPPEPAAAADRAIRACKETCASQIVMFLHNADTNPSLEERQHTTCCLLPLATGCLQSSAGPTQTYIQTGASAHDTSIARQILLPQAHRAGHVACLHHHRSIHTSPHRRAAPVAATNVASVHPSLPSPTEVRWLAHSRTLQAWSCLSCTHPPRTRHHDASATYLLLLTCLFQWCFCCGTLAQNKPTL